MSLIDATYLNNTAGFFIEYDETNASGEKVSQRVNSYIRIYERKLMEKTVGKTLYDALLAGLSETTPEARWLDMKSQLVDTVNITSPIANYVYINYWQQTQRSSLEKGDAIIDGDGITISPNITLACEVWNEMVNNMAKFTNWLSENSSDYPELDEDVYYWSYLDTWNGYGI